MIQLDHSTLLTLYAHEIMSDGYSVDVTILSQLSFESLSQFMGEVISFSYQTSTYQRSFQGHLVSLNELNHTHNATIYRLQLVSSLNLLVHDSNYRSFKNQNLQKIINTIFAKHGFSAVQFKDPKISVRQTYLTQFNENTNHFIRRLIQEHHLCSYYDKNHLTIDSFNRLTKNPKHSLNHSELKQANYHIWQFKNNTCYSNYPNLYLGDHTQMGIITELRHYIDAGRHYYYQFVKFSKTAQLHQLKRPKTHGVMLGSHLKNYSVKCHWDTASVTTLPLKKQSYHKPSACYHFLSATNSITILDHINNNSDDPSIIGFLYTPHQKSPLSMTIHEQLFGFYSPHKNKVYGSTQFNYIYFDTSQNTHLISNKDLFFQSIQMGSIQTPKNLKINSHRIHFISSHKVTLKCGDSVIELLPHKISITSHQVQL